MSELKIFKQSDVLRGHWFTEYCRKDEADRVIAEKDNEIRRLRRALYKACANWADVEVFERTVGIDDLNVEAHRWAVMRDKCIKKAKQYR